MLKINNHKHGGMKPNLCKKKKKTLKKKSNLSETLEVRNML